MKTLLALIGGASLGSAACRFKTDTIEISKQTMNVPGLLRSVRIVAVSDIHAPFFNLADSKLITMIDSQSPDIFILGGDIIDQPNNENLVCAFGAVNAADLKVSTLGNWEYNSKLDMRKLSDFYQASGISMLVNDALQLDDLTILGFDDWVTRPLNYDLLVKYSKRGAPLLVISHCPVAFNYIPDDIPVPVIVISGHTHGGQVVLFGVVLITPKGSGDYLSGWYHRKNYSMYVMRGIGTTPGIPLRIGSTPEILVLDLMG